MKASDGLNRPGQRTVCRLTTCPARHHYPSKILDLFEHCLAFAWTKCRSRTLLSLWVRGRFRSLVACCFHLLSSMPHPRRSCDSYDPLAIFTSPPANETPEARAIRLRREAEAQRVSDAIDESIKAEKAAMRKQKTAIKMLLLGQSESGA